MKEVLDGASDDLPGGDRRAGRPGEPGRDIRAAGAAREVPLGDRLLVGPELLPLPGGDLLAPDAVGAVELAASLVPD